MFIKIKKIFANKQFQALNFLFIALICCNKSFAESTIINVPSSSAISKNTIVIKESNTYRPFSPNHFVTIIPRVIIGLGNGVEISGGVQTTINDETSVRGRFAAKKVFLANKTTRLTVGTRINPSFVETVQPDNFTYTHLTTRIKQTKTSITAGTGIIGDERIIPNEAVGIIGFDQIILSNKLRFAGDWISGDNGLLSVGIKYRPIPTISITNAVSIPNANRNNLFFRFSISKVIF